MLKYTISTSQDVHKGAVADVLRPVRGRLEDRPRTLKVQILPYDDCDVDLLLRELEEVSLIHRYKADNVRVVQILNFAKHQNPDGLAAH